MLARAAGVVANWSPVAGVCACSASAEGVDDGAADCAAAVGDFVGGTRWSATVLPMIHFAKRNTRTSSTTMRTIAPPMRSCLPRVPSPCSFANCWLMSPCWDGDGVSDARAEGAAGVGAAAEDDRTAGIIAVPVSCGS